MDDCVENYLQMSTNFSRLFAGISDILLLLLCNREEAHNEFGDIPATVSEHCRLDQTTATSAVYMVEDVNQPVYDIKTGTMIDQLSSNGVDDEQCDTDRLLKPPNRIDFERTLSLLNGTIEDYYDELNVLISNKNNEPNALQRMQDDCTEYRRIRDTNRITAKDVESEIFTLKGELVEKNKVINDLEATMPYKNKDRLVTKLNELEGQYKSRRFTNVRDEQALVKEIDKLQRNRTKLSKYEVLLEQQKSIESRLKQKQDVRKKSINDAKRFNYNYRQVRSKIFTSRKRIDELKQKIGELRHKRHGLIEDYNQQLTYWVNQQRKTGVINRKASACSSYPSTFPSAGVGAARSSKTKQHKSTNKTVVTTDDDIEEYEPFYEKKTYCRRLIHYLESVIQQLDPSELSNAIGIEEMICRKDSSDSADDFPAGFVRLRREPSAPLPAAAAAQDSHQQSTSQNTQQQGKLRKRNTKKSSKKGNQPISLTIDMHKAFAELEVDVPTLYQDVPRALIAIRKQFEFYDRQTSDSLPSWDTVTNTLETLRFDYATSDGDMTTDSGAWGSYCSTADASDSASLASRSQSMIASPSSGNFPASIQSPTSSCDDHQLSNNTSSANLCIDHIVANNDACASAIDCQVITKLLIDVKLSRPPTDEGIDAMNFVSKESSTGSNVIIGGAPLLDVRQSSGIEMDGEIISPPPLIVLEPSSTID